MHGSSHVWHLADAVGDSLGKEVVGKLHIQAHRQRRHLLHDSLHAIQGSATAMTNSSTHCENQ